MSSPVKSLQLQKCKQWKWNQKWAYWTTPTFCLCGLKYFETFISFFFWKDTFQIFWERHTNVKLLTAEDFFYLQILYFVSKCFSVETYFKIRESLWKTKWNLHMYVIIVLQIFFLLVTETYQRLLLLLL